VETIFMNFFLFGFCRSSPEAMTKKQFTSKGDVYSFGITLFEIMTKCRTVPFPEIKSTKETVQRVINGYQVRIIRNKKNRTKQNKTKQHNMNQSKQFQNLRCHNLKNVLLWFIN
jgi:hypothetical protein